MSISVERRRHSFRSHSTSTPSPGISARQRRHLSFTPKSASVGLIQIFRASWLPASPLNMSSALFSRGAHDATATFDIGNPNINLETAKTIKLGLRAGDRSFRFEATAYYTKFNGFIYRRLTGNTCEDVACVGSADPAFHSSSTRRSARNETLPSAAASSRTSWMPGRSMAASGALKTSSTLCARPSATAPMLPGCRRCASAAACWLTWINLLHAFAQNDIAPIGENADSRL